MRTRQYFASALLLAISALASDPRGPKFSPEAGQTAGRMQQTILAEIEKEHSHKWAGEYYAGDGLGVNISLTVAPKSGFVFEWRGCLGLYDRNYGDVTWDGDRIRLTFTFENKRKGFQGLTPEVVPVAWGTRRYLVPADDIIGFCNNVNSGREPRERVHGVYLLRWGDEKIKVSGFPTVPTKYRPYLLSEPVEAEIVSVGRYVTRPSVCEWKFKDTPVTLSAGSNKGLRIGMELRVTEPRNVSESVRITEVEESRCKAMMIQIGEDAQGPQAGWKLSTQSRWKRTTKKNDTPVSRRRLPNVEQ